MDMYDNTEHLLWGIVAGFIYIMYVFGVFDEGEAIMAIFFIVSILIVIIAGDIKKLIRKLGA